MKTKQPTDPQSQTEQTMPTEDTIETSATETDSSHSAPTGDKSEDNSSASKLEAELAELREKCDDLADKNLRMLAEFDNYRRRTAKEKLDLQKTAGEGIFKDMLPLIDDFERARNAMAQTDDIGAVREGVELIYQKFLAFLSRNDVKPIDTENVDFDTAYHEAVTTFPTPDEKLKGKVIDCTQRGYTLGDKVIRFAKVVVGE